MEFKILGRDPAAILYSIQALLAVLVAFGIFGLNGESADWVMTIANGAMALIVAIVTRPFVVGLFTGAVQTIMTGVVAFGVPGLTATDAQQGVIIGAISAVLALMLRANLSPVETAITRA